MEEVDNLSKHILRRLVNGNIWGGKHTPFDFVKKGIPEHYQKTHKGQKIFGEALKELINNGWIIISLKRTGGSSEEHISLNPRMVKVIGEFLEKD